jgi:2-methylisocitrate lyase-like PEP mutase family enzyme
VYLLSSNFARYACSFCYIYPERKLTYIYANLKVSPKSCGHTEGKKVYSREQAVMHIKAAVDARNESGSDLVIIGRTDSRQAVSFEEALGRAKAFADAGADVLLIDALASVEEMKKFCAIAPGVPKMVMCFLLLASSCSFLWQ